MNLLFIQKMQDSAGRPGGIRTYDFPFRINQNKTRHTDNHVILIEFPILIYNSLHAPVFFFL